MLICLYYSYDTLTSLLKGELRARNDQIYKESLNNTKEQTNILSKKKKLIKDLETFASQIKQIKNSSRLDLTHNSMDLFRPVIDLKKNLELAIQEELYYLYSVNRLKNTIFDKLAAELDNDLSFTDSKIEEINGIA